MLGCFRPVAELARYHDIYKILFLTYNDSISSDYVDYELTNDDNVLTKICKSWSTGSIIPDYIVFSSQFSSQTNLILSLNVEGPSINNNIEIQILKKKDE